MTRQQTGVPVLDRNIWRLNGFKTHWQRLFRGLGQKETAKTGYGSG